MQRATLSRTTRSLGTRSLGSSSLGTRSLGTTSLGTLPPVRRSLSSSQGTRPQPQPCQAASSPRGEGGALGDIKKILEDVQATQRADRETLTALFKAELASQLATQQAAQQDDNKSMKEMLSGLISALTGFVAEEAVAQALLRMKGAPYSEPLLVADAGTILDYAETAQGLTFTPADRCTLEAKLFDFALKERNVRATLLYLLQDIWRQIRPGDSIPMPRGWTSDMEGPWPHMIDGLDALVRSLGAAADKERDRPESGVDIFADFFATLQTLFDSLLHPNSVLPAGVRVPKGILNTSGGRKLRGLLKVSKSLPDKRLDAEALLRKQTNTNPCFLLASNAVGMPHFELELDLVGSAKVDEPQKTVHVEAAELKSSSDGYQQVATRAKTLSALLEALYREDEDAPWHKELLGIVYMPRRSLTARKAPKKRAKVVSPSGPTTVPVMDDAVCEGVRVLKRAV